VKYGEQSPVSCASSCSPATRSVSYFCTENRVLQPAARGGGEGEGSSFIRKSWVAALRGRSHDSFAARDAARRCRGSSGNLPYLVFARPAKHKPPTEARKLARNGMDSLVGAWNHLYPRKATNAPHKDEADPLLADGRATVESEAAARSPFLSREKMPEAGNGTQFPFLA